MIKGAITQLNHFGMSSSFTHALKSVYLMYSKFKGGGVLKEEGSRGFGGGGPMWTRRSVSASGC